MLGNLARSLSISALVLGILVPEVQAQDVRVFQQKPFLRQNRVEVAPVVGMSLNDAMVEHIALGGTAYYHFTESIAGGITYWHTFGYETSLYDKVQNDYSLMPSILKTKSLINGQASYAFLYGKFALFNTWVVHYDTTAQLGLGIAQTQSGNIDPAGNYGIGQRYFLTDWLSLNLELRHYMIFDDSLFHNITAAVGVGLFAPFHFEYEHPK